MSVIYTTRAVNNGGRGGGRSTGTSENYSFAFAPPRELSGKETDATNPEQLFAAGYSACFNSALNAALRDAGVKYTKSEVGATVHLLKDPDRGYELAVELTVKIDDFPQSENQKFADLAHQICPYSKAVRGNISVTVTGLA